MKIFNYALIFLYLFCAACKSEEKKGVSISNDKLYKEYQAEMNRFNKDFVELEKEQVLIRACINKMALNPAIMNIIKDQRHVNDKYLGQLQQAMDYLKIRMLTREKFIQDNGGRLTQSDLDKDFETYKKNKETNPEELEWEKNPVQINTGILTDCQ